MMTTGYLPRLAGRTTSRRMACPRNSKLRSSWTGAHVFACAAHVAAQATTAADAAKRGIRIEKTIPR
jgi:hypothetical protein